jgi:hypothetical protein
LTSIQALAAISVASKRIVVNIIWPSHNLLA